MSLPPARSLLVPVLVSSTLLLGGCGGDNSSGSAAKAQSGSAARAPAPSGGGSSALTDTGDSRGAVPGTGGGTVSTAPRAIPDVQALIRKATVTLRVKDVAKAVTAVETAVRNADGLVAAEQVQVATATDSTAELTLRVPDAGLDAFLRGLPALGKILTTEGSTEDVTAQVADVKSRVTTQQRSIERVRVLLARASTIEEVVRVEAELARREADLESLQAQQRVLADRTALATVTLHLVTAPVATVKKASHGGFLGGLRAGSDAFLAIGVIGLTVAGAALPFLLTAALLGALAWPVYRRRHALRHRPPAMTDAV